MQRLRTALVLGGGGARGAYEAGVVSYLRDELERDLGRSLHLDVLSGTSVGAIHACFLASTAARPEEQGRTLVEQWRALKPAHILDVRLGDILRLARESLGRLRPGPQEWRQGGLIDPSGLESIVLRRIPWLEIGHNIRRGLVSALSLSATHVSSGRTVTFVERADGTIPAWSQDPNYSAVATRIGPRHALASAAIPLLFPAVRVEGRMYVDGGLRLNVPLSPAIRLGTQRVVVISLRHQRKPEPAPTGGAPQERKEERTQVTAPFLMGKTLNALLLDRTDQDLDRLRRLNSILESGTRGFGPSFARTLNDALLPHRNQSVRYVRNLLVRPSRDIGALAAEYARSPGFRRRARGLAGWAIRRLAEREADDEADLVSYLLFDGEFAEQLIELGRNDARALRAEWARFLSDEPECAAEAAQMEETAAAEPARAAR